MADEQIGTPAPDTSATTAPDAAAPPAPPEVSGLAYEDAWDKPGATGPADADGADPFEQYRSQAGHEMQEPAGADPAHWNTDAQTDWGRASKAIGLDGPAAQGFLTLYASMAEVAPASGHDDQQTVTALRADWGADTESTLAAVEKFCGDRPQLAAFLDSTGLGSDPSVLRLLGGAAMYPDAIDRKKAAAFAASVLNDPQHVYWRGDRRAVAAVSLAMALTEAR